jgi:hypothetical protein
MLFNFCKIACIALLVSSCTQKIGRFTSISTQNVRGLEYSSDKRSQITTSRGKSCSHRIYITRAVVGVFTLGAGWFMPAFDTKFGADERDRLTDAVDNAITSGKQKGIFDGDILVNATIKEQNIILPLIYGYKCMIAEGDVTSSVVRNAGFLEKK